MIWPWSEIAKWKRLAEHHDLRATRNQARADLWRAEWMALSKAVRGAHKGIWRLKQKLKKSTGEPGNWHGAEPVRRFMAEKEAEIARWKARSWDENVKFLAEAKENLLKEYIHLTELYGAQKHEIRKLKSSNQQLMAQAVEMARLAMSFSIEEYPYMVKQAIAFLDSPEAQAFLKEHL